VALYILKFKLMTQTVLFRSTVKIRLDIRKVEYWRIETGSARGGLLKRPAPTLPLPSGTNAYVCSMEVRDFFEN
jgi:hypothetical protein